ncbi:unnamed protein product [Mesocestoides corti]|nr:unnamed protein product [Mesocestoides corti]
MKMEETAAASISDPNSEFAIKYPNGLSLSDLLPFYEDIAQNRPIQLEWKFPGRIKRATPQEQETRNDETLTLKLSQEKGLNTTGNRDNQLNFAEFDFDTEPSVVETAALVAAQRRPLGGFTRPVRERRVARLDKILQEDMMRRRLEMEQAQQLRQHQSTEKPATDEQEFVSEIGEPPQEQSSMEIDRGVCNLTSSNLPTSVDELAGANEEELKPTVATSMVNS